VNIKAGFVLKIIPHFNVSKEQRHSFNTPCTNSKFTFLFKYIWVYLLHPHIFGYYVTISGQTSYAKSITIQF